ncbi:MAG: general secretion pathway protein J [Halieaceae bacterium]|jgi:general secretion pathway protein J
MILSSARPRHPRQSGFTLVEVLLSMAITTVVAVIAYGGLDAAIKGVASTRDEAERLHHMDRALQMISRDLRQFIDRPVRDEFGVEEPSIFGGEAAEFALTLTRGGWANTNGMARSQLQRVRYFLEDGSLWRENWLVLDRSSTSISQRIELLDDVDGLHMKFLANVSGLNAKQLLEQGWIENWNAIAGVAVVQIPLAVEVELEIANYGSVRRVYEVPQS